jgi:hypothetical protein
LLEEHFGLPHPDLPEEPAPAAAIGVLHFLLIPEQAVDTVVRELRELALGEVEVLDERLGGIADVEVFQPGRVADLRASADEVEATLTELAERHGGEYDGHEWALPN